MRRAFTQKDFLNCRMAAAGDSLEYGRTNIPANMGGECDPVYGFWEHNREIPVYVPDGSIVEFEMVGGGNRTFTLRRIKQAPDPNNDFNKNMEQAILKSDTLVIKLIDLSFDPKDWGKRLTVKDFGK